MPRSPLFGKQTPGLPIAIEDMSRSTGNRFYVDSGSANNGSTSGYGQSPDSPFDQIESANNAGVLTASNGDIVYIMPGHVETVDAAADLDCDIAGVVYQGIGEGSSMPQILFAVANTADMDVDAAGVTFRGIHFVANFLDIAAAIDVNADDCTIDACRFTDNTTILNALVWIQPGGANVSDRLAVTNCWGIMKGAANTHFINLSAAQDGILIADNRLMGNWETMAIGGAGIVTYCSILRNDIFNEVTDADHCINMGATATGIVAQNMVTGGHASAGIVNGDLGSLENYYEGNTTDLSGSLEPGAS